MKIKSFLVASVVALMGVSCGNGERYSSDLNDLPEVAKNIITTNFPDLQVSHIKIDKNIVGGSDYDVVLTDGTQIDFDSKGQVDEIDCGHGGRVPDALVMKPVLDYVAQRYPGQNITKYNVEPRGYEVELQSGLELVFDKQGVFQRVDD